MNDDIFQLVENTQRSIFLTGKAGTGKTTFLNDFVSKTRKKHIVVAPTGIAAINAGGVTVHSMFGLPLKTFLPTTDSVDRQYAINIQQLIPHFKYRKDKLKILRELELVIIDEVSMLRADVLDMIDFSLRTVRRNQEPFGGVQMLFIGDLFQLPPVVRNEHLLSSFYSSPFFFDSKVLKTLPVITLELMKVYRQKDEKFVKMLNAIRDGDREKIDFDQLNKRYQPDFEAKEEQYVYLTSHNRMAENINRKKLNQIKSDSYFYKAQVYGDFNENQFPNEQELELKVGAQVMFIRNDSSHEKKYYNGKLAEVVRLTDDEIWVQLEGSEDNYQIKKEVWERKVYSIDAEKNIQQEVLGSFEQFPVRLAWAVTIHKSQGLTFDKVIIDAGKSFASGQVYVALSRCRSLEGIVLKSKINPHVIFKDDRVIGFQEMTFANDKIKEILNNEKYDYSIRRMLYKIDCTWLKNEFENWKLATHKSKKIDKEEVKVTEFLLKKTINEIITVFEKFSLIIQRKAYKHIRGEEDWQEIEKKSKGAVAYFFTKVQEEVFENFKQFYAKTKGVKGLKAYNTEAKSFLDDIKDYLQDLQEVTLLDKPLFNKEKKKKISSTIAKIPSHVISYQLFEDGKTISEIANERGLVKETIYGHLAKFATKGVLDINRLISTEKIDLFSEKYKGNEDMESLSDWKKILPKEFTYHEIRILINHFAYLKEKGEES